MIARSVRRSREVLDTTSSFDRTFVGLCDLSELRPEKSADLGFMLMRRHWGQGLAQEAVTAVLAFAQQLGLRSAHARVHEDNERSVRLLERTGLCGYAVRSASRGSGLECFVTVAASRECCERLNGAAAQRETLIWLAPVKWADRSLPRDCESLLSTLFRALRSSDPSGRRHRVLATVDAADIRGLGTAQTVVRRGAALALGTDVSMLLMSITSSRILHLAAMPPA